MGIITERRILLHRPNTSSNRDREEPSVKEKIAKVSFSRRMKLVGCLLFCMVCVTLMGSRMAHPVAASPPASPQVIRQRLEHALWAYFAGDALSSPSHWFYGGPRQVEEHYGRQGITDYTKPSYHLAGSILNKSNLSGAGRATRRQTATISANGDSTESAPPPTIIGHVINHGKQDLWDPSQQIHYHATLEKGENTLEVSLARVLMRSMTACKGKFNADHFRKAYMEFMMRPGSHNDTYASTCHRMFFANLVYRKLPPEQCPDNDAHNVDTIDGLVLPTIVSLAAAVRGKGIEQAQADATSCVAVTRQSPPLQQAANAWAGLIYRTVQASTNGSTSLTSSVRVAAKSLGYAPPRARRDSMTACYLDSALPALLDTIVAFDGDKEKKNENVWQSLLSNANAGGENVHRGSCLGAVLGASAGTEEDWSQTRLVQGLYHKTEIEQEIKEFVQAVFHSDE